MTTSKTDIQSALGQMHALIADTTASEEARAQAEALQSRLRALVTDRGAADAKQRRETVQEARALFADHEEYPPEG